MAAWQAKFLGPRIWIYALVAEYTTRPAADAGTVTVEGTGVCGLLNPRPVGHTVTGTVAVADALAAASTGATRPNRANGVATIASQTIRKRFTAAPSASSVDTIKP
jgi:hypothetical protein